MVSLSGLRSYCLRSVIHAVVVVALATSSAVADVSYIYDSAGRLIAVVDSAQNSAAIYQYDAVGNLLSITRQSAAIVSVIDFAPGSGPAGTPVAIHGTGFSPTASSNSVSFNGVAANVVSASPTEIVATVPAGATTGPIAVTSPGGSATSSASFIVGTPGAPTISGFTPTIGVPGTTVALSGTNFETIRANDIVTFNTSVRRGQVTAASSTALDATVPGAVGSGRLAVATPAGKAVSSADFFVAPSPYAAADVEVTDRITVGGSSRVVTMTTSGKIALFTFDAQAGQRVGLGVSSVAIGSGCCVVDASILNPDGTVLASVLSGTTGATLETPVLALTGTYTVLFDPRLTYTGSATLTLSNDLTGTVAPTDAPKTETISHPGQTIRLTFSGATGQRFSLAVTNVTTGSGCCVADVVVLKPDGTTLTSALIGSSGAVLNLPALTTTGTYEVAFTPRNAATGSATFTLSEEISGTLAINGAVLDLGINRVGQNARLTFSGTAGQRLSLAVTNAAAANPWTSILNPDGSTLVNPTNTVSGKVVIDLPALPATGSYTVFVDPNSFSTGNVTLTLSEDVGGSLVVDGASVGLTIARQGQRARLTFTGAAGQRVSLGLSSVIIGSGCCVLDAFLLKPDGTTLSSVLSGTAGASIDTVPLPATGTYTALIDPRDINTGTLTVTLSTDVVGTLAPTDSPLAVSIARAGQNARLSFSGVVGQRLSVALTAVSIGTGCCTLDVLVYKPDATTLSSTLLGTSGGVLDLPALPATGTYEVVLSPRNAFTGNATVTLSEELTGSVTVNGSPITLAFSRVGQNGRVTFAGTEGQQVTVSISGNTAGSITVALLRPDGSSITSTMSGLAAFALTTQTLAATGTYSITVDPFSLNTGSVTVTVTSP